MEDANERALRSSQAWTDGATRSEGLRGREQRCGNRDRARVREYFSGAEDSLVGFISTGKLEFQGLADSILADLARTTVRQTITAPLAGALQSAFAGNGLFGLFHEGGIAGERPPAVRYADARFVRARAAVPRRRVRRLRPPAGRGPDHRAAGRAGRSAQRIVREEKTAREQRPITVMINVTAADANSFRASQGQIAAEMAQAIERASRNR